MSKNLSRYARKEKTHSYYCYPGTEVLINKLNIKNVKDLASFESDITLQRQFELEYSNAVQGRFSASHLKRIHKHIFQDIYPFAGKYRKEDMWKDDTFFCKSEYIQENLLKLLSELKKENYLKNLNQHDFINRISFYMAELNMIHPFREGNGRAIREFVRQLALYAGYRIDWSRLDPEDLLKASITSAGQVLQQLNECVMKATTKIQL